MDDTKTPMNASNALAGMGNLTFNIYHKMMEEVQDYAIILLNKEGTIINWNQGAEKIKGYTEAEIIGKNFRIFYQQEDRNNKLPEKLIEEATINGRAVNEGWRIRKNGSRFWGSITITALHDDQDHIIGFVKVSRDLSERKLAEDMMRQYAADLEDRNRDLEQFAYIASHDLQEPMRKIQTFIQLIDKSFADPETTNKYLDKINSSAKRMASLINAILNYSRLSNYEEKYVNVDLNEVLKLVKTDFELLLKEKGAVIKSDKLPVIKCISLQINQLFLNLISNSLKFSSRSPEIQVSSRLLSPGEMSLVCGSNQKNSYHELIFEDHGIGFDQQYGDQIFTMFRRLHSNQDYPGSGIGLALCKKIAENHHGFIRACSEPGKGASFRVYLPEVTS
jgi:PAS domain S-box-containing protein